jgi:hypothetical protein
VLSLDVVIAEAYGGTNKATQLALERSNSANKIKSCKHSQRAEKNLLSTLSTSSFMATSSSMLLSLVTKMVLEDKNQFPQMLQIK